MSKKNKIPKILHYCWFGNNKYPKDVRKYMDSWHKYCPDYKIMRWDETNFDINCCQYVKDAYKEKKWAFVTDYVRLYALVNHGGIYLDTDVEILRPLDCFLKYDAFSSFESGFDNTYLIPTGIMGCKKYFTLFNELLNDYNNRSFYKDDGSLNITPNVKYITDTCIKYGLKLNNKRQNINGFEIFSNEYFCPKNCKTREIDLTSNTYTIHHFIGSWTTKEKRNQSIKLDKCENFEKKLNSKITNSRLYKFLKAIYVYGLKEGRTAIKNKLNKN